MTSCVLAASSLTPTTTTERTVDGPRPRPGQRPIPIADWRPGEFPEYALHSVKAVMQPSGTIASGRAALESFSLREKEPTFAAAAWVLPFASAASRHANAVVSSVWNFLIGL